MHRSVHVHGKAARIHARRLIFGDLQRDINPLIVPTRDLVFPVLHRRLKGQQRVGIISSDRYEVHFFDRFHKDILLVIHGKVLFFQNRSVRCRQIAERNRIRRNVLRRRNDNLCALALVFEGADFEFALRTVVFQRLQHLRICRARPYRYVVFFCRVSAAARKPERKHNRKNRRNDFLHIKPPDAVIPAATLRRSPWYNTRYRR